MKSVELKAASREDMGSKGALKALRTEGRVPAILYGGKENINFHVDEIAFSKLINTSEVHLIDLNFGDKTVKAVIREVQFHPVSDEPIHADFMEVFDDKPITIGIPVRFTGNSVGVMKGGSRREKMRKLIVKALPNDVPEEVVVDITKMKIGDVIQVEDINIDGVEFLDHPKAVIVAVKMSRLVVKGADDDEDEEDTDGEGSEEGAEAATEEATAE
ncbi:MAG: 50S ribosomal protein L25 [Flavobacteriales bacterium]|nr:50S ribosomal protein L25 [Flavobacteriales bacterium]|tara:strand:+ start:35390 stop:36037 length:648 start_codon:yes stop_codon:yes gene_type:complete